MRLAVPLSMVILALAVPGSPAQAQCGGNNQTPCKVWERIPSCNSGLVEDFGKGKCVKPATAAPAPKPAARPAAGAAPTRTQATSFDPEELHELTGRCEVAYARGFWNYISTIPNQPAAEKAKKCSNFLGAYRCVTLLLAKTPEVQAGRLVMLRRRFATELAQNDCGSLKTFPYAALSGDSEDITESGGKRFYRAADDIGPVRTTCEAMYPGPPVAFWDPINSGSCWTCPVGWDRTIFPVNQGGACEKGGKWPFGQRVAATHKGKPNGCPAGAWAVTIQYGAGQVSDFCHSCPAGFERFDGFPRAPQEIAAIYRSVNRDLLNPGCAPLPRDSERRKTIARPRRE